MPYIIKFLLLTYNISRIEFYIFNLSFLFLIAALSLVGGRFLKSFIFCMGVCFIILILWLGVLIINTTPPTKNKKEFALIILLTLCSTLVVDNLLLYYIYFEMLLVSTSNLNQLTIVGVGIDRMMNQPLTQTRLRLPPTKKGGSPQKIVNFRRYFS